ncbi:hypothetical protein SEA_ANGELA_270 [Streptomyces phage Angela]|nr:hypothetical protein SEA_ANGELA_13 [Streptomyces phage Angela]UVK61321.1 hypothetical protein SEA_ANGELA_270 [Streptomyces phage Angela]
MAVKLAKDSDNVEKPGFIRKGWLEDIWTVPEDDDEPEYLVDCN